MRLRFCFILITVIFLNSKMLGNPAAETLFISPVSISNNQTVTMNVYGTRPSPLLALFRDKQKLNRRMTAALLAFPFPFGIVGLHRIYLGSAPYVPVVYIASLGGAFGILPLIDCIVLLADQKPEKYDNNKKVFMWVE